MATPAPTLKLLWDEVHARWPDGTRFDGIMGDASHQARKSDHNDGNALDIGIIPESSPLGDQIAELLLADSRSKYVIWNRRIDTLDGRGWRPYTGPSPHTEHVHLSIHAEARDDMRPWLTAPVEEDDMFTDEDRSALQALAATVQRRQRWAFEWAGAIHLVHVTGQGDLVHSAWTGTEWTVEKVGTGCDPGIPPEVTAEYPSRIRVWCRSADRQAVVHTVYEAAVGTWSSSAVTS